MPYIDKPAGCNGCPAEHIGMSFVRPTGPPNATLALVGQGPGIEEALRGTPFVGLSGMRLDKWMYRAGLERHRVHLSNVVWCHLPEDRPPTVAEVRHCRRAHWQPALDELAELKVIVPVGVPAATAILGKGGVDLAGSIVEVESLDG